MNRTIILAGAAAMLAISGCANLLPSHDPARDGVHVAIVNSLTWTNPLTGKEDGSRTSWPLKSLQGQVQVFPLAQLRQCEAGGGAGGEACAWGVMSATRTVEKIAYVPGGVRLDLALSVDVDRKQEVHRPEFNASMSIPSNVEALHSRKTVRNTVTLEYGKVQRIDFDFGVRFSVCALRYDEAGKALDVCDIPYI
jgi:hypothetical protein